MPYSLTFYTPEWAIKFQEMKVMLLDIFADKVFSIEHVGSTSIPGMKAKPIVDVLMLVENINDLKREIEIMEAKGYIMRENVLAERSLLLEKIQGEEKVENIHIFEKGAPKSKTHFIGIRDYLKAHPNTVKEYENLKENLQKKYPNDYSAYRAGKNKFLQKLEKLAEEWEKTR